MKTHFAKKEQFKKKWYIADAAGIPLGRLATKVAVVLMGKHRPQYTPNVDIGDYVVVINAGKVMLTGKKLEQKYDFRHSGYPDGHRLTQYKFMIKQHPERTVELAVKGMLPKTRLGSRMIKKLKVYRDDKHTFVGLKLEELVVKKGE